MPRLRNPAYVPIGACRYRLRQRPRQSRLAWSAYPAGGLLIVFLLVVRSSSSGTLGRIHHDLPAWLPLAAVLLTLLVLMGWPLLMRYDTAPRAADPVLLAVDDGGIYLQVRDLHGGYFTGQSERVGWPQVAEVVVFHVYNHSRAPGRWEPRLIVVTRAAGGSPAEPSAQRPGHPWHWPQRTEMANLSDTRLRLRRLAAAVHAYAPTVPVRDVGAP